MAVGLWFTILGLTTGLLLIGRQQALRMTMHYFNYVLAQVRYPGLAFAVNKEGDHYFLRVVCKDGADNVTGEATSWKGRKWRLSTHMTAGEIVQTAFLAVTQAEEHERREKFLFEGEAVFDPHYDIYKLAALHRAGALEERDHGQG